MSRLSDIINRDIDFTNIYTWVDFGTGNGSVVKELKWNIEAIEKIAIDKYPQPIGDNWTFADELDDVLFKKRDLFTSIDSIEHLIREDGEKLIDKIDKHFKYKLFFTPRGFLKQDETTHPDLIRINPWQKHLCGWDVEDFTKFGYTTMILDRFHYPPSLGKYFDALISYKID